MRDFPMVRLGTYMGMLHKKPQMCVCVCGG